MSDKLKTGKDAKFIGKIAGCPEIVDARPDLNHHLEDTMSSISTPGINGSEGGETMESAMKPPVPPKENMNASHPWKPKGRKA